MPRIPFKLIVFAILFAFFYLYGLPRKAAFVNALLRDRRAQNALDSAKALVTDKVRGEICRFEDACFYEPVSWEDFAVENASSRSIIHTFKTEDGRRKFLFRIRSGRVSEIIDLR